MTASTGVRPGPMSELFDRVALTEEDDRAYIVGAIVERAVQARQNGERYTWQEFVREALMEAAHR